MQSVNPDSHLLFLSPIQNENLSEYLSDDGHLVLSDDDNDFTASNKD